MGNTLSNSLMTALAWVHGKMTSRMDTEGTHGSAGTSMKALIARTRGMDTARTPGPISTVTYACGTTTSGIDTA